MPDFLKRLCQKECNLESSWISIFLEEYLGLYKAKDCRILLEVDYAPVDGEPHKYKKGPIRGSLFSSWGGLQPSAALMGPLGPNQKS